MLKLSKPAILWSTSLPNTVLRSTAEDMPNVRFTVKKRRPSRYTVTIPFHCFGCGAHGDVIDLIRKMEGRSFSEVCEALGGMQSFSGARAAGKRQREVQKRRNRARNLKDDYNKALKVYRRNEEIIECLKPEGPDDKADSIWLAALARRSSLYLKLLAAEEDINKAERGGAANGKLQRVIAE